jgi:O-antigen ligase
MDALRSEGVSLANFASAEASAAVLKSSDRAADRRIFIALMVGLAVAPFWLGSDRPIAWGFNALYYGALAIAYEGALLIGGREHPVALRRIWFPALAFACVVIWSLLQIAPFMPESWRHPIWRLASDALGEPIAGSISVNPDLTVLAVTRLLTCGLVFWLSLQLCRSERRARAMVKGIALIGLGYAVYGILAFFVWPDTILWFDKEHYRGSLTSTFINRNSYATYAGIGLICALACALRAFQRLAAPVDAGLGQKVTALIAGMLGSGGGWIAGAFIIAVALVMTGSRGGVACSVAGILVFVVLGGSHGRERPVAVGIILLLAILVLGVALLGFGDFLAGRLNADGVRSGDRLAIYALTWRAILDSPWLGSGYGAFQDVFKLYRDSSVPLPWFWDRAHDTYLELLQGLGMPVTTLFMLGVASVIWQCINGVVIRRARVFTRLAAASATVIICLHALVDFSLQVQAVALTWAALLGGSAAES